MVLFIDFLEFSEADLVVDIFIHIDKYICIVFGDLVGCFVELRLKLGSIVYMWIQLSIFRILRQTVVKAGLHFFYGAFIIGLNGKITFWKVKAMRGRMDMNLNIFKLLYLN